MPSMSDLSQVADRLTSEHSDLFSNLRPYLMGVKVGMVKRAFFSPERPTITVMLGKNVPTDLLKGIPTEFDGMPVRPVAASPLRVG